MLIFQRGGRIMTAAGNHHGGRAERVVAETSWRAALSDVRVDGVTMRDEFDSGKEPITQVQALRRMTMEQRWRVAQDLCATAREWKRCAVRALHPDWDEETIRESVRRSFLHAGR